MLNNVQKDTDFHRQKMHSCPLVLNCFYSDKTNIKKDYFAPVDNEKKRANVFMATYDFSLIIFNTMFEIYITREYSPM